MTCACGCGRALSHKQARGLHKICYNRIDRAGMLYDFPRPTRSYVDTADDVIALRQRGWDLPRIATVLGVRPGTVVRNLERYRALSAINEVVVSRAEIDRALTLLRADLRRLRRSA